MARVAVHALNTSRSLVSHRSTICHDMLQARLVAPVIGHRAVQHANIVLKKPSMARTRYLSSSPRVLAGSNTSNSKDQQQQEPKSSSNIKPHPAFSQLRKLNKIAVEQSQSQIRNTISAADPKSKEYKSAARRYTTLMVSIPLVIVLSYEVYERLVLHKDKRVPKPKDESESTPST